MGRWVVVALALLGCEDRAIDPEVITEPPLVVIDSATVRWGAGHTLVDLVLYNEGALGFFRLEFWAQNDTVWLARRTSKYGIWGDERRRATWLVVRSRQVEINRVEAWARALDDTVWAMTDRHEFGG